MRAFWWKILFDVACTLTVFTLLFSLAGYGGGSHWVLDLFSHFRVQYLAGGMLLAAILLWLRRWRWGGVALLCVGMNAVAVLPWYGTRHRGAGAGTEPANLRIVLSNVFTKNAQTQRVLDFVRKEAPDILVLQEVDSVWRRALRELDAEMGHFRVYPQEDNFGIGIWSRLPLKDLEVFGIGPSDVPTIRTKVEVAGTMVEIIATHPLPPIGATGHAERNLQLATIAGFARDAATPVIVVGDLNVTMWSPSYSTFIRSSGLVDARRGFGIPADLADDKPVYHDTAGSLLSESFDRCEGCQNRPARRVGSPSGNRRFVHPGDESAVIGVARDSGTWGAWVFGLRFSPLVQGGDRVLRLSSSKRRTFQRMASPP